MESITKIIPKTYNFDIVPMGDVQYGNTNTDIKKFKAMVNWIKNEPNCYTILMGDLCEGITISDKRFDILSVYPNLRDRIDDIAMAEYEEMVKILYPIKDKILCSLRGNHGETLRKHHGVDFDGWLCKQLGITNARYMAFLRVKIKDVHTGGVTFFLQHGFSASRKKGAKVNAIEDLASGFNADVYCLSNDTEVLTKNGWKFRNEILDSDEVLTLNINTNKLEYNNIIRKVEWHNNDSMYNLHTKSGNFLFTNKHRIVYRYFSKYLIDEINNLENFSAQIKIPTAGNFADYSGSMSIEQLSLIGYLISEGHFRTGKSSRYGISLYQNTNSSLAEKFRILLSSLNIKYSEYIKKTKDKEFTIRNKTYKSKDNCSSFYIHSKDAEIIKKYVWEKRLSREVLNLPPEQLRIILMSAIEGDGHFTNEGIYSYYSKDKILIDQLQEICVKIGYRSTIRKSKTTENYTLIISEHNETIIVPKKSITKVNYNDMVWCLETLNTTLVIRRNGSTLITGNCLGHSHELNVSSNLYLNMDRNGNIAEDKRYFCHTGSFLKSYQKGTFNYSEVKAYPPLKTGVIKLMFNIKSDSKKIDIHARE